MVGGWHLQYLTIWILFLIMHLNSTNAGLSMYVGKFQKQDYPSLQVKLVADNYVISLLECSTFCRDGCDGFVFCRSDEFQCFQFVYISAADATDLSTFSTCSFYASDQSRITSLTTISTTSASISTTPDTTTVTPVLDSTTVAQETTTGTTTTTCINLTGGGCDCPNGATDESCSDYMIDCYDYLVYDGKGTGLLYIKPLDWAGDPFLVRCLDGNTLIQMRDNTSACRDVSFNRSWAEYGEGFGDIANGCFWLGNDNISSMTLTTLYYLVFSTDIDGIFQEVVSYFFEMKSAVNSYQIRASLLGSYYPYCDGLSDLDNNVDVKNEQFYTYDNDRSGCAVTEGGGWWYATECAYGNLNSLQPKWPIQGTLKTLDISRLHLSRIITN